MLRPTRLKCGLASSANAGLLYLQTFVMAIVMSGSGCRLRQVWLVPFSLLRDATLSRNLMTCQQSRHKPQRSTLAASNPRRLRQKTTTTRTQT